MGITKEDFITYRDLNKSLNESVMETLKWYSENVSTIKHLSEYEFKYLEDGFLYYEASISYCGCCADDIEYKYLDDDYLFEDHRERLKEEHRSREEQKKIQKARKEANKIKAKEEEQLKKDREDFERLSKQFSTKGE